MGHKKYNTKKDMLIFSNPEKVSLTTLLNKVDANGRLYDALALQGYSAEQVKEILYDIYKTKKIEKLKKHNEQKELEKKHKK